MRAILTPLVRILAFVGKEIVETFRRPGAILSLVLGPFLIMAIFGLGYSGVRRPLETIVVATASTHLPTDVASYQEMAGPPLRIVSVTSDRAQAESALRGGTVDMVVVAPEDPEARFRAGEQSTFEILIDAVDPVDANYAGFLAAGLADAVNRRVIEQAVQEGEAFALDAGQPQMARLPPNVVAAPTRADDTNVAPSKRGVVAFFGPAVMAMIMQHLAITLAAISLVREGTSGVMELFRISPLSAAEVLAGKVVAFGVLGAGVAALTLLLLTQGFSIPVLGPPALIAATIGLLLLASLGFGLLIAMLSDSERQAVQLSLLALLASVFFGGFVMAIDQFTRPVRILAYGLPVTHGIRLLQDLLLRGETNHVWEFGALGLIAAGTLVFAWLLLRRNMRTA